MYWGGSAQRELQHAWSQPEWIAAAKQNKLDVIADPKLRALIAFAEPEIFEVIGIAAFAVYANVIADATANSMFDEL